MPVGGRRRIDIVIDFFFYGDEAVVRWRDNGASGGATLLVVG